MLEFQSICKSFFGVPVLRNVSFVVQPGQTVGLVGENGAGKSTLMNILGGNQRPDSGIMLLEGTSYAPAHPREATSARIAFIHQELNLFGNLSIADNLFVAGYPRIGATPFIDRRAVRERTAQLLAEVALRISGDELVEQLSPGERQLVEVARALNGNARLLILDEPTTSLTAPETERLFALLKRLRGRGMSMIYISHVLDDVRRLSDTIVVLRDGAVSGAGACEEFDADRLISLMVGRPIQQFYPSRPAAPVGEPALQVRQLSRAGVFHDISFAVHRGEVLGISGLMGSGRTELARALFGLDAWSAGEVRLLGRPLTSGSPRERVQRGMAFVTEDRRFDGLCLDASISENLGLVALPAWSRSPAALIDFSKMDAETRRMRSAVRLNPNLDERRAVKTLSGGNQQKVVIGKWLLSKPSLLLLDEPTRGIDVGAKVEIYTLINELATSGAAILLISSEIEELIGMCDRIIVMGKGRIRATIERANFDREQILAASLA